MLLKVLGLPFHSWRDLTKQLSGSNVVIDHLLKSKWLKSKLSAVVYGRYETLFLVSVTVPCAITIVLLWLPLWSVRRWIDVARGLVQCIHHLVVVIIQLAMTGKILDVLYVVALVAFYYLDEATDAITILGWWGCNRSLQCDRSKRKPLFATVGVVA
jgi:hypothetical protein